MENHFANLIAAALLALLLCSMAAGQNSQDPPKLRYVTQLSVRGCRLFIHDNSGASDFAILPAMCVTDSLDGLVPMYDPITEQLYVNIPVLVRDDRILTEVANRLSFREPKSVSFSTVRGISASVDKTRPFANWDFCSLLASFLAFCDSRIAGANDSRTFMSTFREAQSDLLSRVLLSTTIISNGTYKRIRQRITLPQRSMLQPSSSAENFVSPGQCRTLRFLRAFNFKNCTTRAHEQLDPPGRILIEPLLCPSIIGLSRESIKYDYSRDMHYLRLNLTLVDLEINGEILNSLARGFPELAPRSISSIRLWSAQQVVSSALRVRFEISPLMVSTDWMSAELRLFCGDPERCQKIRSRVASRPDDFWRHIKWTLRSVAPGACLVESEIVSFRRNVTIMQRIMGSTSFQRNWTEYKNGFGDGNDFWIGLDAIHRLSGSATLRIETTLVTGRELHAEYSGFAVSDESSGFNMTYREMLRDRSSFSFVRRDPMTLSRGRKFSTTDRDNDYFPTKSCSVVHGMAGWWFGNCALFCPTGRYPVEGPSGTGPDWWPFMGWMNGRVWLLLRSVRLILLL